MQASRRSVLTMALPARSDLAQTLSDDDDELGPSHEEYMQVGRWALELVYKALAAASVAVLAPAAGSPGRRLLPACH